MLTDCLYRQECGGPGVRHRAGGDSGNPVWPVRPRPGPEHGEGGGGRAILPPLHRGQGRVQGRLREVLLLTVQLY